MSKTLPLSSVKAHLSELVDRVEDQHDRVVITRNGKPAAVLISPDDLESLEETLAILSDPAAMDQVRESELAIADGEACGWCQKHDRVARSRSQFRTFPSNTIICAATTRTTVERPRGQERYVGGRATLPSRPMGLSGELCGSKSVARTRALDVARARARQARADAEDLARQASSLPKAA